MSLFLSSLIALCIGFVLDMLLGDPHSFPHIIRLVGTIIGRLEKLLRRLFPKTPGWELTGGVFLVFLVIVICAAVPTALLLLIYRLHWIAGLVLESLICYQMLAARCLKDESMLVYHCLKRGDIQAARRAVSMIVGRDTQALDDAGVTRAAVETVAENASDGVLAPLLYMALGGAPLGLFYKCVNTMDSMVGYKNDKYLYFGRAAARLDDVLNFIPARVTGLLMVLSCLPLGFDASGAYRIYKRDRHNHKSPNSAHSESACAGALGIELGGSAYYHGKLQEKPTMGDNLRPIEHEDIRRANRLMITTSILALLLCVLIKAALIILI